MIALTQIFRGADRGGQDGQNRTYGDVRDVQGDRNTSYEPPGDSRGDTGLPVRPPVRPVRPCTSCYVPRPSLSFQALA